MDYTKELEELIEIVVREGGSDIHFSEGMHPTIRVSGFLVPITKKPVLTKTDTLGFVTALLSREKRELFLKEQEADFSYAYGKSARFRGNAFFQKGSIGIALRLIPTVIKTLQDLHLPPVLETFTKKQQGFFLVVGPVGQGKTTTLASMVEMINNDRPEHIITIEDPIEFIFEPKKSIIDQREVHIDTKDFHIALQSIFRQDIDVLMVGEMRGLETISTAVTAAETGHLVMSTLHTNNAAQTIDRIIDSFPPDQQDQIRTQLSESMSGIFSQRLIPRISGGLIPAYELLINTNAVANLIREKRTHEINTVIETGLEEGMIDMNRCLADLVRAGEISVENAYLRSFNPKTLKKLL
ncbi:MAG: PilT/PilU family type 4a pilus ATPase [Candidatus Pacebacteria bacterium]|nr:PilT/PilU family type 4a pilus ATPase [Candidatus Paceibacterota bacterium]MDD5357098.1 PilT/PilU family type 4a pilus ATPase [Candidatus Paceibacterota bacterium]